MAAVTLSGNAYLTTCPKASITTSQIPDGYTSVEIDTQVIEDLTNKITTDIQIPTPPTDQPRKGGSAEPNTLIIDLLKIKQTFSVTGKLSDDATTSAFTKKANLKTIIKYGGNVTLVWGTGSTQEKYSGSIKKSSVKIITDAFVDSGSLPTTTPTKGYDVLIQFVEGTDRGG